MGEAIELRGERNRWTLGSHGGRLAGWLALDGADWRTVCKGDPNLRPSQDAHRAIVMFPWVNRIGGDSWEIEGERVPLDLSGSHTHLHGVTYDKEWQIVERSDRAAAFRFVVERQRHYPRRVECVIRYAICEAGNTEALEIAMTARNLEESAIAFVTMGTHPYFTNPFGGKVDEMILRCAQAREFSIDARMIPTGLADPHPGHDFRAAQKIDDRFMDYGFILQPGAAPAAELSIRNYRFAIHAIENCGYMQIYIPPHREEIALEPQSGGADAFRVPEYGLKVLAPGESFRCVCRMSARFD